MPGPFRVRITFRFGIATTQDAFEHEPLDHLLWQFMIGYYLQCEGKKVNFWQAETDTPERTNIEEHLRATAERYAARIPGLSAKTWDSRTVCGDDWALLGDAAGFADPVTGEGIYYALRSAELFAECFLSGAAQSYETDLARRFRRRVATRCANAPAFLRQLLWRAFH